MRCTASRLLVCAVAALSLSPSPSRAAAPVPYKGAFNFRITSFEVLTTGEVLVRADLSGIETHMGKFRGEVEYLVSADFTTYEGDLIKIGANGDALIETVRGTFTTTGSFGDFQVVGGTGRLRGASGSGTFVATWDDPSVRASGSVVFGGVLTSH